MLANNSAVDPELKQILNEYKHPIHGLKALKTYNLFRLKRKKKADIVYRLENYYKVMVSRHPFTRMVSAFKDKLHGNDSYFNRIIVHSKMLPAIHPELKPAETETWGPTFEEFIQYYLDYDIHDVHFNQQHLNCFPCKIHDQYNYMAKLETNLYDMNCISARCHGMKDDLKHSRLQAGIRISWLFLMGHLHVVQSHSSMTTIWNPNRSARPW